MSAVLGTLCTLWLTAKGVAASTKRINNRRQGAAEGTEGLSREKRVGKARGYRRNVGA